MNYITEREYMRGFQCPKMLWLDKNMPEIEKETGVLYREGKEEADDFAQKRIYETVKNMAIEYFSPCVQVKDKMSQKEKLQEEKIQEQNTQEEKIQEQNAREEKVQEQNVQEEKSQEEKIKKTKQYLEAGEKKIADAAFAFENLFCEIDMLLVEQDSISIVYINSSTKTKMKYYDSMAYQYYILGKIFPQKTKKFIHMHINGKYIRQGKLDLEQLFLMEDCTEEVISRQKETGRQIHFMKKMVKDLAKNTSELREEVEKEIKREVGVYCYLPNQCQYIKYCHRDVLEPSVFSIHGLSTSERYELYHAGIVSFFDVVQKKVELLEGPKIQVETEVFDKEPTVNKNEIKAFLNTITYPLYFLDFESFQQVVPQYEGVRPYLPIPFQYSLHVQQEEGGSVTHYEFLAKEGTDPRREVAKHLCMHIPKDVCILAYNMGFEKSVIKNLASLYPDLREHLLNLQENVRDLMTPFRNYSYYCKEMEGSHSIKSVLPALYPKQREYDYEALAGIHNGQEAMNTFSTLTEQSKEEREKIRQQLLDYCALDTFGMVKILEKLRDAVKE